MHQTARAATPPPMTHRLLILGLLSLAATLGAQQPPAPAASPAAPDAPAPAAPAAPVATPAPLPEKSLSAPAAASAVPALDPKSEEGFRDTLRRLMVERKFDDVLKTADEMDKAFPGNTAVSYYRARAKEGAERAKAPDKGGFKPFRPKDTPAPAAGAPSAAPKAEPTPEPAPAKTAKPKPAPVPDAQPAAVSLERPMSGKTIPLVIAAAGLVLIVVLVLVMQQKKKQGGGVISSAPARAPRASAPPPPPPAPAPIGFGEDDPFGGANAFGGPGGFDFGETRQERIEEGSLEMQPPAPKPAPAPANAMPELDFFDAPNTPKPIKPEPAPAGESSFAAFSLFDEEVAPEPEKKAAPKTAPVEENHDPISLDFEFGDAPSAPPPPPPASQPRKSEHVDLPSFSEEPITFESAIGGGGGGATARAPWEEDSSLPALDIPGGYNPPPLVAGAPPPPALASADPFAFDLPDLPMLDPAPGTAPAPLKGPSLGSFRSPDSMETIGGGGPNPFADLISPPRASAPLPGAPSNFGDETIRLSESGLGFPKPGAPRPATPTPTSPGMVGGVIDETIILSKKEVAKDPDIISEVPPRPVHHASGDQPLQVFEGDGTIRLQTAGGGGDDGFERERVAGMAAFREARWEEAVYHLSVAASLRPEASDVKDQLRRARRMSKEQGS